MTKQTTFGLALPKAEGAPVNPLDALSYTGPGATPAWFNRQCEAWTAWARETSNLSEDSIKKILSQAGYPHAS